MHYSGQAASARIAGIKGHEDSFNAFKDSVSSNDLIEMAENYLKSFGVPDKIRDETMERLKNFKLTISRRQLIFNYKMAFESDTFLPTLE